MERYNIRKLRSRKEQERCVGDLEKGLRKADRREIQCVAKDVGQEIRETVEMSASVYEARRKDDGRLIVAWGLRPVGERMLIWCLGTDEIKKFWRPFAVRSRKILEGWAARHGCLFNAVAKFNTEAVRWLGWCGARFGEERNIGGEMFLPFEIRG